MTSLKFKIPLYYFESKYKGSTSKIHRMISNSQRKVGVGGISNRDFWSQLSDIKYRCFYSIKYVHFSYFIPESIDNKTLEKLIVRIMITLGVRVEINCNTK
jgi:hypothetical protein